MKDFRLYVDGEWVETGDRMEVRNKYSGEVLASVPVCGPDHLDRALASAKAAARPLADLAAHRRSDLLRRIAGLMEERREELARTIAAEAGKALKFSRAEVDRAVSTFTLAAEEARRVGGEVVPLDAVPAGEGYFGFWRRRPVGVVAAITPFNFPLNLVAHKVAPALAAGCPVILKPASTTPLSAILLAEILEAAGVPRGAFHVVVGSGRAVGEPLAADPRVAKVSFTGSRDVGRHLVGVAGIKKITLELGNTSPVVLAPDADLDLAARRCAMGAYYNSGQVCISVQRIYAPRPEHDRFSEAFVKATEAMVVGDPLDERVDVGPMIDLAEAERVEAWVDEALQGGARVATGGRREGALYHPTVLLDATASMRVVSEEVFGPVASILATDSFEDALEQANASDYGLQVAVFTRDLDRAFQAIQRLDFGGVMINESPAWRADHMPYGGNRQSGLGREGVRYAMEEMTNMQMVVIRTPTA